MKHALGLLCALLLSACASDPEEPEAGRPPAPVDVEIRQVYDMSEGAYTEGAYSYVRIEHPDGNEELEIRLDEGRAVGELRVLSTGKLSLAPGSYRLVSFQRPCNASCDYLSPPPDECSAELRVREGDLLVARITVLPAEGCTIELR